MSKTSDFLDFQDLSSPIEVLVSNLFGKDYILREATGDVACKFQNKRTKCMKFGTDGKTASIDDIADVDPLLLSMCLFAPNVKNPGTFDVPVPITTIRSWPSRIVKKLVEKAKEISELEDVEETVADLEKRLEAAKEKAKAQEETSKNVSGSTTSGSE